jgi:hypothetical protein
VTSTGAGVLEYPARHDSIAFSHIGGAYFHGAKWSMVTRCRINGYVRFMQDWGQSFDGIANSEFDTLRYNHIQYTVPSNHGFRLRGFAQNCLIDSNRVFATFGANSGDGVARIFYNSSHITLRDNAWTFEASEASSSGEPWNGFVFRDSARHYTIERDTVLMGTQSAHPIRGQFVGDGTWSSSVSDIAYQSCLFKSNSYLFAVSDIAHQTFERCVFASSSSPTLWFAAEMRHLKLRHNTVLSSRQCVRYTGTFVEGCEIVSNIFYSSDVALVNDIGGGITMFMDPAPCVNHNGNLYFSPRYSKKPGDRSIGWCCFNPSAPGPSAAWFGLSGQDGGSRHGSPMFQDSSFVTLDARLRPESYARALGIDGSDAGAFPFGESATSSPPPGAIQDLGADEVSSSSVVLVWSAPGANGATGTAGEYDARVSLAPINAENFEWAADRVCEPSPATPGTVQRLVWDGLTPGTSYHFAIRTRESTDGTAASSLSNVDTVRTLPEN